MGRESFFYILKIRFGHKLSALKEGAMSHIRAVSQKKSVYAEKIGRNPYFTIL